MPVPRAHRPACPACGADLVAVQIGGWEGWTCPSRCGGYRRPPRGGAARCPCHLEPMYRVRTRVGEPWLWACEEQQAAPPRAGLRPAPVPRAAARAE